MKRGPDLQRALTAAGTPGELPVPTSASARLAVTGAATPELVTSPGCPSIQTYLGRLPSGGLATQLTTLNIVRPGTLYPTERQNQLDLRFAKIVHVSHTRYDVGIDLYNVFNANTATAFQSTYAATNSNWLAPTAIMSPRLLRFNVTATF